jgi:hypothetical protein
MNVKSLDFSTILMVKRKDFLDLLKMSPFDYE